MRYLHCNPRGYSVPHVHRGTFKNELDRLVKIGVLSPTGRSEWIAGTFIIPKKLLPGETVHVSDGSRISEALTSACVVRRTPFLALVTFLHAEPGTSFVQAWTSLCSSTRSSWMILPRNCVLLQTPFGLYRYNKLPMGVNQSPDIAQEVMEKVLKEFVR